jgi:hypothetical protein
MNTDQGLRIPHAPETPPSVAPSAPGKTPWQEPKLTFVEPTLTIHGSLEELTGGYFGGFSPQPPPQPGV